MANEIDALTIQSILAPQTQALQQIAMRPQKSQVTTKSTPYALEDLLAARAQIGQSRRALDEALKGREDLGYTLANALAGIPQQQGYGSWLGDFARAFGGGFSSPTNAKIDRMQKAYETEVKDLATILALDKAMGDVQTQEITYKPIEEISIKEGALGTTTKGQGQAQAQIPALNPEYWDQMISNFDEGRKTEAAYRNMSQARRNLRNKTMIMGTPAENYARDQFAAAKGREFLPLARNALKGAGQITDFEDKKYSEWLNKVQDPVQLKDTAVRIIDDVATKNGWSKEQKAKGFELLGLTSEAKDLLEQQRKAEPERIRKKSVSIEDILKQHGATRIEQ